MNRKLTALLMICAMLITGAACKRTNDLNNVKNMKNLNLTAEWDKTFPKSNKVNHSKVTFTNRYGITLAADMYVPKNANGKLPAIAVCGPFGAVKEQAAIIRQGFTCQKSLAVNRPPSAYEQALSWLVHKTYKTHIKSASHRTSEAGAFPCRFFGNFPERCRPPPSFRFTCQPVN